jgi:hypothetical protein
LPTGKEGSGSPLWLSGEQQIAFKIDRKLLLGGRSIGGLLGLVKKYFAAVLHRKAGVGDTVGQEGWIGGRSFEKEKLNFHKARHNLHKPAHLLVEFPGKRAFISTIQTYLSGTPVSRNALRLDGFIPCVL